MWGPGVVGGVGAADDVAELMAGCHTPFGVAAVPVGAHGARRQEELVADLPVGESLAGQADDLELLGSQLRYRVGHDVDADSAGAKLGLGPVGVWRSAQCPENVSGFESGWVWRQLIPSPPSQPLSVGEVGLGPLERPLAGGRIGQRVVEMGFGLTGFGQGGLGQPEEFLEAR